MASVVDLRRHAPPQRFRAAADANALFFVHYPSFSALARHGDGPREYQLTQYGKWLTKLWRAQGELFTASSILGEVANTVEWTELKLEHLRQSSGDAFEPKASRYRARMAGQPVRRTVLDVLAKVQRDVQLLTHGCPLSDVLKRWADSAGDYNDAALVCLAGQVGIDCILSDDADLATFPGITVLTANPALIEAAERGGRLVK